MDFLFPSSQFWFCSCLAPLLVKKISCSFPCKFSQQEWFCSLRNDMIHLLHVRPDRNDEPSLWSENRRVSIPIHFRSLLSPMRLLGALVQLSLMKFSASGSLLLLDLFSVVSNSLLDLNSSFWLWISFTKHFVPLGIATSIPYPSRIFTTWISLIGPMIVRSGIASRRGISEKIWKVWILGIEEWLFPIRRHH